MDKGGVTAGYFTLAALVLVFPRGATAVTRVIAVRTLWRWAAR